MKTTTLTQFRIAVAALLILLTLGCKNKGADDSASSDSSSPVAPPSAPTVTFTSPLAVNLYSKEDGQDYITNYTFDNNSTVCAVSAAVPKITCTVTIPEMRTFTSSFHFQYAWVPSKCNMMEFHPYYYQRSTNGAYTPPGATSSVDCSKDPLPIACFNGAATLMVGEFPKKDTLLSTPDEKNMDKAMTRIVDIDSSLSKDTLANNLLIVNDYAGNRAANHDLSVQDAGFTYGAKFGNEQYVANTYHDYVFICRDFDGDPMPDPVNYYQITLKFVDEDSHVGAALQMNHFATWKDVP